MRRLPAAQMLSAVNDLLAFLLTAGLDPQETLIVSVIQRQVSEWSSRTEQGPTENYGFLAGANWFAL